MVKIKIVMTFICAGCKVSYGKLALARECERECLAVVPRFSPGSKVRVKDGGMLGEIICVDRIAVMHSNGTESRSPVYLVKMADGTRRPIYEYELGWQEFRVSIDGAPKTEPATS